MSKSNRKKKKQVQVAQVTQAIQDVSKKAPQNLFKTVIIPRQINRSQKDIADLKRALMCAESPIKPHRLELYTIYKNIVDDAHLHSQIQTRKEKVMGKEFKLVDSAGTEQKEKTKLFQTQWFSDFLELAWESKLYGYSLINFGDIINDRFQSIELVDRENVIPEKGQLLTEVFNWDSAISYEEGEMALWNIGIGKRKDLGLLLKVAALVLIKDNMRACYADYCEVFGIPTKVGKTDMSNPEMVDTMTNFLANMGSAPYAVIDKMDEITFAEASKGNGEVFLNIISFLNAEISKAIVGGTMISDNGSSRSQSETHERTLDDIVKSDARFLEFQVNDLLIPHLNSLGFNLGDVEFKFDNTYKMSFADKLEAFKAVSMNYEVDVEWIKSDLGIPVLAKKEVKPNVLPNQPDQSEAA